MADTVLSINKDLAERIRAHGAQTYPHECCGALLGRDSEPREIVALFPLINRRNDSPRNRFAVSSQDVVDAEKSARAQGLDVVGWYHSHPDHPARPSQYDRDHAWPWYSYIIVSVAQGQAQEMTSWRLDDNREQFSPEGIQIQQSASV
jgi:proteasome lid subunit RPN8/RPN11